MDGLFSLHDWFVGEPDRSEGRLFGGQVIGQAALAAGQIQCGLEAVGRVTDKALLVHGGLGYLKSSRIEMLYRDARLNWLEEGTPTIHKLIIARALLEEEFTEFGRGEEIL